MSVAKINSRNESNELTFYNFSNGTDANANVIDSTGLACNRIPKACKCSDLMGIVCNIQYNT